MSVTFCSFQGGYLSIIQVFTCYVKSAFFFWCVFYSFRYYCENYIDLPKLARNLTLWYIRYITLIILVINLVIFSNMLDWHSRIKLKP